jgi:hypothetical protein
MVPKSSKPSEAKSQHERFVETARALECDEDKERFEEKLKKIAKAKPKTTTEKKSGIM